MQAICIGMAGMMQPITGISTHLTAVEITTDVGVQTQLIILRNLWEQELLQSCLAMVKWLQPEGQGPR